LIPITFPLLQVISQNTTLWTHQQSQDGRLPFSAEKKEWKSRKGRDFYFLGEKTKKTIKTLKNKKLKQAGRGEEQYVCL